MTKLPDEITISWCIEDVKEVAKDLTRDECRQVLQLAKNYHDATIGVNWDVLEELADTICDERHRKSKPIKPYCPPFAIRKR